MARTDTLGNFLTDVADAIREKKGTSETIQASQFDTEIANLPGGGLDWSAIGYEDTPQSIVDGYNYAKEIQDNWDSSATSLNTKFRGDKKLFYMPLVDTSNATKTAGMFYGCSNLTTIPLLNISNSTLIGTMFYECSNLTTIPLLNTKNATNMNNTFAYCISLTDESLDNILQMCINATSYTGTKTLTTLGITNTTYYPTNRIEALPHYQDFINAGWTIGY